MQHNKKRPAISHYIHVHYYVDDKVTFFQSAISHIGDRHVREHVDSVKMGRHVMLYPEYVPVAVNRDI